MGLQLLRGRQSTPFFVWNNLTLGFLAISVLWMPHEGMSNIVVIAEKEGRNMVVKIFMCILE